MALLLVLAGVVTSFVSLVVGIVIGMKFAHRILEREGSLVPVTPPATARGTEHR